MAPYLKMTLIEYTSYVPSFMLLSKSAQIKCLGALLLCTSENGSGDTDIQYQFLPSESEGEVAVHTGSD